METLACKSPPEGRRSRRPPKGLLRTPRPRRLPSSGCGGGPLHSQTRERLGSGRRRGPDAAEVRAGTQGRKAKPARTSSFQKAVGGAPPCRKVFAALARRAVPSRACGSQSHRGRDAQGARGKRRADGNRCVDATRKIPQTETKTWLLVEWRQDRTEQRWTIHTRKTT